LKNSKAAAPSPHPASVGHAHEEKKMSFLEMLSKLSPGKKLRTSLDDIQHARTGALIVINCPGLRNIAEGGFRVNCRFTAQKLAELAKMDGAIIVSSDLKKILFANVLLVPDNRINSNETGTRHKAAERTSKQFNTPVITVSERRGKISFFYEDKKYVLQNSEALLSRAIENLNVLEKQRDILNELMTNLNILETTGLVSVGDVCSIIQRMEIISRVMNTLKRYIIELGKEGIIIQMRVRELYKGIDGLKNIILKDYTEVPENAQKLISSINFDGLLDSSAIARIIFNSSADQQIFPRGFRILGKLNLTEREMNGLILHFKNLGNILNATDQGLHEILHYKTENFKKELENLREQIMVGKKI
jgi:diadenylate cyclase